MCAPVWVWVTGLGTRGGYLNLKPRPSFLLPEQHMLLHKTEDPRWRMGCEGVDRGL